MLKFLFLVDVDLRRTDVYRTMKMPEAETTEGGRIQEYGLYNRV